MSIFSQLPLITVKPLGRVHEEAEKAQQLGESRFCRLFMAGVHGMELMGRNSKMGEKGIRVAIVDLHNSTN